MKIFLCFQNDNKSHLCQGNCRNMDWIGKVLWITSPTSITKTKVTFVKKIAETLIEIANCYEELPLLPERKKKLFMWRKQQKDGLIQQSVMNNFSCFQNENKSHLCQQNSKNMDWNNKDLWVISLASGKKIKVIDVKKIAIIRIVKLECHA